MNSPLPADDGPKTAAVMAKQPGKQRAFFNARNRGQNQALISATPCGSRLPVRTVHLLLLGAAATMLGCASAPASVQIASEASASPYFSLGAPAAYKAQGGLALAGRVCRRLRITSLSPARVRLEHVTAVGEMTDIAHAGVPTIQRSSDQACRTYKTIVAWQLADGDTVRACFDHGRPCPASTVKAIIAAPATPSSP